MFLHDVKHACIIHNKCQSIVMNIYMKLNLLHSQRTIQSDITDNRFHVIEIFL